MLATGAAVAAAGSFLFALAPNLYAANLGRLLIGGSVGVAWVGTLKLAVHWLPARLAGTATGVANMGSMTGAMLLQPLIGVVLDQGWLGDLTYAGARAYGAQAYRDARNERAADALIRFHAMNDAEFRSIVAKFSCEVYWGDCDPAGIIFYPTYFRWMDAACWAFLASVGYDAKRMRAEHLAMPLVSADCQFLYPAQQGDRCVVRSSIARFGGKSFVVAHEVQREDGMPLAKGSETRVWGRFDAGPGTRMRGQAIPEDLKALFRA